MPVDETNKHVEPRLLEVLQSLRFESGVVSDDLFVQGWTACAKRDVDLIESALKNEKEPSSQASCGFCYTEDPANCPVHGQCYCDECGGSLCGFCVYSAGTKRAGALGAYIVAVRAVRDKMERSYFQAEEDANHAIEAWVIDLDAALKELDRGV